MRIFLFFTLIVLYPKSSFAYLDPGTGQLIIQALVGALAATITTISIYWYKVKVFLRKLKKKFFSKKNVRK